jgi:hypothetical protein
LLVLQCILGVFAPVVGGADNNPVGKRLFTGRGKKAINIAFLDAVFIAIKFTLYGVEFIRPCCFSY